MGDWAPPPPDSEGYIAWSPKARPDVSVKTYYRLNGKLGSKSPFVNVHGGPGGGHNASLESLRLLDTGHPMIFYDQVGCGKSTLLKEDEFKPLWVEETFIEEMEHLVEQLHLESVIWVGYSWGSYIAHDYVIRHPDKSTALLSCSGMQDSRETTEAIRSNLKHLPEGVQKVIADAEAAEKYDTPEYERAFVTFINAFVLDMSAAPPWVMETIKSIMTDTHVYQTMWGPSEFTVRGTMQNLSLIDKVSQITCPVLVLYGSEDELMGCQHAMAKRLTGSSKVVEHRVQGAKHIPTGNAMVEHIDVIRKFLDAL